MTTQRLVSPTTHLRRNQLVELLRIASAFGIIGFHAKAPASEVFYSGLVFFLILSPLTDTLYNWDRVRSATVLARVLLLPWAFWMCAYAAANVALGQPILPHGTIWSGILMGTRGHLWFLPYLFVIMLALNLAKRGLPVKLLFGTSAVLAASLLATAEFWRPWASEMPAPVPQWLHASAAIFIGIALGLAPRLRGWGAAGLALIAGGLAVALARSVPGVAIPYAIAIPLTAAAAFIGDRWPPRWLNVQPVADCMFGVYLVHLLALPIASRLVGPHSLEAVVGAFVLSLGSVWLARRYIPLAKTVLG